MYIKPLSNENNRVVYKRLSRLVTKSSAVSNEDLDKIDLGDLVPIEAPEEYDENGNDSRKEARDGATLDREAENAQHPAENALQNPLAVDGVIEQKKVDFSV